MTDASPAAVKAALRRELLGLRKRLAAQAPDAAQQAARQLPAALLQRCSRVAGYRPSGAELDPGPLMARFAEAGAGLALPMSQAGDPLMSFRVFAPGDALAPDAHGMAAPLAQAAECEPDLIVVPLLGFDARGGRIGRGGGHYDRVLEAARARRRVFVLGLAYSGQELPSVAVEAHDQQLDAILTEKGYIQVSKDL